MNIFYSIESYEGQKQQNTFEINAQKIKMIINNDSSIGNHSAIIKELLSQICKILLKIFLN